LYISAFNGDRSELLAQQERDCQRTVQINRDSVSEICPGDVLPTVTACRMADCAGHGRRDDLGFIRDRQRAGIEAAKAKGIDKGRPATFDRARIVALRKEGMGATEIAKAVGCKRGNVYKTLTAAGLNGGNS
jgi:Helix-turn-helix domain of resolvase